MVIKDFVTIKKIKDMDKFFIFAIISGIIFGVWPNLASKGQLSSGILMILMSIPLFVCGLASQQINKEIANVDLNSLLFVGLGVTINAFAFLFYGPVIKKSFETGSTFYIVIAIITAVVSASLYEIIVYKKPFDLSKMLALALIIIGIFILKRNGGSS